MLAIDKYKQALDINPNYLEPILELARIFYEIGNYDYAYTYIQKAMKLSGKKDELQVFAADIEAKLGKYESAEKRYKAVINNDPLNTEAHNGLAELYLDTNRNILAKNTLLDIIKTDNKNYRAISMLAKFHENIDKETARKYYIMNIEKNSLNPDSFLDYSIFCFNNGDMAKAVDYVKTSLKLSNKIKYKKYYGKYLLFLNKSDDALEVFKDILHTQTSLAENSHLNYINYFNLAMAYYLVSDYDAALISLDKAIALRDDDEIAVFYQNNILINKYNVDNRLRINASAKFYDKAMAAKQQAQFDLYINFLKESLRLYPKNVPARLELADYFKSIKYYQRYINELEVAARYTDDNEIKDKLEIEQMSAGYRLGDDWNVNQYEIKNDTISIPLFVSQEIHNEHYNIGKIYCKLLENLSYDKVKFEFVAFDESNYTNSDKINLALENHSPFYTNIYIRELDNGLDVILSLYNATNNELIKQYQTSTYANNKVINSANNILSKFNEDIPFKAHIVKISGNKAIINAGKRSNLKPKNKLIILANGSYPLELSRSKYLYGASDVKGSAKITKVDENISEIQFKDNDFFKQINLDDILIF